MNVARRRPIKVGAFVGAGVVGAVGTWIALETYLPPFYHSGGWFRRTQYQAVVERVATLSIPEAPARPTELLMKNRSDLASIGPFGASERDDYYQHYPHPEMIIYAMRTKTDLRITLITHDAGHGGLYGFAYTRAGWTHGDGVPGHVWLDGVIDDHWARIINNLQ